MIRRTTVETYCFYALLLCCLAALLAWILGMVHPKPFGAIPAAVWIGMVVTAIVLSGVIAVLEYAH